MVTRIRQLLEQKQLTPTQFADAIGVGRPVMSHILSERNKPSLEVVQRIIEAFPEVSMLWLLRGTGEMLESAAKPQPAELSPPSPANPEAPVAPILPVELPAALPAEAPASMAEAPVAPDVVSLTEEKEGTLPASSLPATAPAPKPAVNTVGRAIRTALPLATDTPAPVVSAPSSAPTAPAAPRPFTAPRFVRPSVSLPGVTQAPAPVVSASVPVSVAAPAPSSVAVTPATPLASPAPVGASTDATLFPFLNDSGKAIRRIVIFYRDGSFADYQPEQ